MRSCEEIRKDPNATPEELEYEMQVWLATPEGQEYLKEKPLLEKLERFRLRREHRAFRIRQRYEKAVWRFERTWGQLATMLGQVIVWALASVLVLPWRCYWRFVHKVKNDGWV